MSRVWVTRASRKCGVRVLLLDQRLTRRQRITSAMRDLGVEVVTLDDGGRYLAVIVAVRDDEIGTAVRAFEGLGARALNRLALVDSRPSFASFEVTQNARARCVPVAGINYRGFAALVLRSETDGSTWQTRRSEERRRDALAMVARCGGNQSAAAKRLGITRQHVARLISVA